jgi:chaperonin GroES
MGLEIKLSKQLSTRNLAVDLDKAQLKKIGQQVVEDFNSDIGSRANWEKRQTNFIRLFTGYREDKTWPWNKSANISIPLLSSAAMQFHARAFEALVPAKGVVKVINTDGKALDQSKRVEKHMNYQLSLEIPDWQASMDECLLMLPLAGTAYKKTYYDVDSKQVESRIMTTTEIVTPYLCKKFKDCPRITHTVYLSPGQIKARGISGTFINVDKISYKTSEAKGNGQAPSQPGGMVIPGMDQDTDSIAAEYQAKVDHNDGIEPAAIAEKDAPRLILETHRKMDLDEDGFEEDYVFTVDKETETVLRIVSRNYMDPVTNRKRTYDYFTRYVFIPNPDSHYGLGFGHLLERLNDAADTAVNQLLDAGLLANIGPFSGFISQRSGLKKGDVKFKMGEFKVVTANAQKIKDAIFPLNFGQPSPVLLQLLGALWNYGEKVSTVTEAMTGQLPPSDTPASALMAVLEQGLKVFSAIHKRLHGALRSELQKIFTLNRMFLDEKVYAVVQDSATREYKSLELGRADYENRIDVIPVSDPAIMSKTERLTLAQQSYEMVMNNPLTQNDPEIIWEVTVQYLEALGQHNLAGMVKKPEPQEPPDLPPVEEEAAFLKEVYVQPLPQQDHMTHLESHRIFMESSWGQQLTPQGKKVLEQHQRETLAFAYIVSQQQGIESGVIQGGIA